MADEKPGLVERLKAKVSNARERWPVLDHTVAMVQHYGEVQGSVLAGAVTFFGFLSFFPILALGFAVIGYVSVAYPDARDAMVTAIEQIFPGIVSPTEETGKISLEEIESSRAAAGIIGFVGVLYSGLGWLSGLRAALQVVFGIPQEEKRNFFVGKGVDLVVLTILGAVLIVSVGVSSVVQGIADRLIGWIGLEGTWVGTPLVWTVGIVLGVSASTLLFFVMFKLLPSPDLPSKPLWQGAFLGAAGFEALKLVVVYILGGVGGSAFAPLAIAITLVVWINYFSRLVMFGASWAMTSPLAHDTLRRRTDSSEADVAVADVADDKARLSPAMAARLAQSGMRRPTGFDSRSAALGAVAAALAALIFWRREG